MSLFKLEKRFDSLDELFADQLRDLYDAEQRIVKALPKMAAAATTPALKDAFDDHLRQSENHVTRLLQVFKIAGKEAKMETCEAMRGLLAEGAEVIQANGHPTVKDAALIASAQRIEHYEMAAYGCARTFANHLGLTEASRLLQQTLDEVGAADKKFTMIAEEGVNAMANAA